MARPVFPHELIDPDYQWLVNTYRENRPEAATVDMSCLPVVLILLEDVVNVEKPVEVPPPAALGADGVPNNDTDFPE